VPGSGAGGDSVCREEGASHWVAASQLGVRGWERGVCSGEVSLGVECQERFGAASSFQGSPDGLMPGSVDGVVCMGGG
jgi:hypothetical protein